jgi:hypothetical protein
MQLGGGPHMQVEQAGQRQVDRANLVEVDLVPEAAKCMELLSRQRQGRRGVTFASETGPCFAIELDEWLRHSPILPGAIP